VNAHHTILLTGATGSLGGQLCAELLTATPASIHCLVRAADRDAAGARLTARLTALGDRAPASGLRLTAVPADLTASRLGLAAREYDALAKTVTTIVHCAASVDLVASYDELAPVNVGSTQNLIALARRRHELTGRSPAFHYVSTLGVFLDARRTGRGDIDENEDVSEATSGPLGYPRSKAVAELALRQSGLPVTVYRPAVVTGDSRSGRTSSSDLLTPLLWACVALGAVPGNAETEIPAERVDVVARSIAALITAPEQAGRAYHLIHPQAVRFADLFAALSRAGYTLEPVPVAEWWRRVEKEAGHPAVRPMALMNEAGRFLLCFDQDHTLPRFRSDITWQALDQRGIRPEPLDAPFLDRLVSHLTPPGILPSPRRPVVPQPPPVRIDGCLGPPRFAHASGFPDIAAAAASCEAAGYGTFWAQEQNHDPVVAMAAASTSTIGLGTAVLIALARSPMTVAQSAHDLHIMSGGRFMLGLGPQFRANLVYRYSMPGDRRLDRLREHVAALRAIWAHWNQGQPLNFRGQHYTHTLASPFFTPPASPYGPPPVMLAATGPAAAELAGETADGLIAPPYANRDHLTAILLPGLERGLERAGRHRDQVQVVVVPLLAITPEDCEHARRLIALWCGTRAYRFIFERYDLGQLADDLAELSISGHTDQWQRMTDRIDDDVLDLFAIRAEPARIGAVLRTQFGGLADRVVLPAPMTSGGLYRPAALGLTAADPQLRV
jgi:probable F420-dependent oxidoreductase